MFNRHIEDLELTDLEDVIISLIGKIDDTDPADESYSSLVQNLRVLMEARKIDIDVVKLEADALKVKAEAEKIKAEATKVLEEAQKISSEAEKITAEAEKVRAETRAVNDKVNHPWRPSAEVVASAAGSLAAIIAILTFEKANVITTKGLGFVPKIKL